MPKQTGSRKSTLALSLKEFLKIIDIPLAEHFYYPVGRFPTDNHLNDFISSIHNWNEKDFRKILLHFIPKSGTYGKDEYYLPILRELVSQSKNNLTLEEQAQTSNHTIKDTEYYRKLEAFDQTGEPVWEGLTWILDLLPHFPNQAISAISAYVQANCQFLPDDVLDALSDCSTMIRARYIDKVQPREVFLSLSPRDFEKLVASLYMDLDYDVHLTKSSYDGGIDVHAEKTQPVFKEKLVIQCKNYTSDVPVSDVRELLGVVSSTKSTKGILVTSACFTKESIKFAKENPSLELIGHQELSVLFNERHGPYWIYRIEAYIRQTRNISIKNG